MQFKYIATTAQSEIWSEADPVLLLGSWCRPGLEQHKPIRYAELPCIWSTDYSMEDAEEYCWHVFRRLHPSLGMSLNRLHGVNHSERYWEVLLSLWFLHFVNVMYDRYLLVKSAMKTTTEAWTTVVLRDSYTVPSTGRAAVNAYASDDQHNLQLFSEVSRFLGLNVLETPNVVQQVRRESKIERIVERQTPWRLFRRLQRAVTNKTLNAMNYLLLFGRSLVSGNGDNLLLYARYHFKRFDLLVLSVFSGAICLPDADSNLAQRHNSSLEVRNRISNDLSGHSPSDEFEALVLDSAPYFIPTCFVEGYGQLVSGSLKRFGERPRGLVFDGPAFVADILFTEYAARCAESGKMLVSVQHGGAYGHTLTSPSERIELELLDRFISFGWMDDRFPEKIIPLPNPHLSSLKRAHRSRDFILYVSRSGKKYLHRLITVPHASQWNNHLDDCETFLQSLTPDKLGKVRFRPSWTYSGFRVPPLTERFIKGWQRENRRASQALSDCRIAVIDHASTGWLEALASNTPTVLFWNPAHWRFRAAPQSFLDELHKVGILHYKPVSAARKVEEVYDHVDEWWNEDGIQRVRMAFCERYAWATPHWRRRWIAELRNLATLARP